MGDMDEEEQRLGIGSSGELVIPRRNQGPLFRRKLDEAILEAQRGKGTARRGHRGVVYIKAKKP